MLFQMSLQTSPTDLAMPVAGGLKLGFTRVFANQFGYKRGYFSAALEDKPYKNNIGEGWTHSLNMHLRVSQYYGALQFIDAGGNPKTYTKYDTDSVYDYYWRRTTSEYEAHGETYKGLAWELGTILKRNLSTGVHTMHFPDGKVYGFSAETAWPEHYARLLYIQNASGAQVTLQYDALGRLYQVLAPSGDSRSLQLSYVGTTNRIASAALCTTTQALETVYYDYDGNLNLVHVHRGDPQDPYNDISSYTYGNDPNVQDSYFLASLTDAAGVTSTLDYGYSYDAYWGVLSDEIVLERGTNMRTRYTRQSPHITLVENLDANLDPVNKIVYTGDWYLTNLASISLYLTPGGNSAQRWQYIYNSDRQLIEVRRPGDLNGGTVLYERYAYNDKGKVVSASRCIALAGEICLTTTYTYDQSGLLLISKTTPDGLSTEYDYDGYNRLIQVTHPSLGVNGIQYSYDAQGNRTATTDPLGNTTTYAYNAKGNMTSTTNALNQTTTMTYDDEGRVISVTDPLNNTTQYDYVSSACGCVGAGKLARITDALSQETQYEYDAAGNMVLVTDALSRSTEYEYDDMNRLTAIESPAGSNKRMTFTYNQLGHLLSQTDFMGRTTTMTYDYQGRITSRTDPVGTVYYTYNEAGMLTSVQDEQGHTVTRTYDDGLRYTMEALPHNRWRLFSYDSAGRLSEIEALPAGDPVEYFYNAATGLPSKTRYLTGATYYDADYVYDGAARVTRINDWLDNTVGIQYAYDALGRLSTLTDYSLSKQLSYTYDAAGHIASMTDYNSHTTNYAYTARGELASITAPGSKVWSFAYNALGQRTQYTHPNGTRTEYGYDTQNRLTSILHKDASTDAVLFGLDYTLNDGGNITRVDHNDASYWTYGYDNRDRLTAAERRNTLGALQHSFGYTYDDADNLTQRTRFQASNNQTDTWAYTYNAGNEQLSMVLNGGTPETRTYDNWGRLATRAQGSYSASYAYRYGSKLYQATSNFPNESNVTLDYGGDGKLRTRTTASETRTYRYDRGWNAVNEEVSATTLASNVFEPGAQVGAILAQTFGTLASGTPVYAYHDHLATVRQWRYPNKNLARANEYDPSGNFYSYSGYMPMPRVYALHEFDLALQQYRAPYRNYSPSMARWTTLDPMGMVDGPNMYAYVNDLPINRFDLMGLTLRADDIPNVNPWVGGDTDDKCGYMAAANNVIYVATQKYPSGVRDKNDHMRHCTASCELRKDKGAVCAGLAGDMREWLGMILPKWFQGKYVSDGDPWDLVSNHLGRFCAKHAPAASCDACCRMQWNGRPK